MSTTIFPQEERVVEIMQILMADNKTISWLKRFNLLEEAPEDWPNAKGNPQQPQAVAHLVALAEGYKNIIEKIEGKKRVARVLSKNEYKKLTDLSTRINKREDTRFRFLSVRTQKRLFYTKNMKSVKKFWMAERVFENANFRKKRLLGSTTKPIEKHVNNFCRDMATLIKERKPTDEDLPKLPLGYSLIAHLINLFKLSKTPQTYDSIKNRISRYQIR